MNKKYIIAGLGKGIHGGEGGEITAENLIEIPTSVGSSSGSVPVGPTKTSDLINDGENDGYGKFASLCSIPSQTSQLNNNGSGSGYPYATTDMIPSGSGESPYLKCGSSILPNYNSHTLCGTGSVISGGYQNYIGSTCNSLIVAGYQNCITGNEYSDSLSILGGQSNIICHDPNVTCSRTIFSSILGGCGNIVVGGNSVIGGGQCNSITQPSATCAQTSSSNVIGGGYNNHLIGNDSSILGGRNNSLGLTACTVGPSSSVIIGGLNNFVGSSYSSAVGEYNCVDSTHSRTHILGSNICSNRGCATFVNKLSVMTIDDEADLATLPIGAVYKDASGFLKIK